MAHAHDRRSPRHPDEDELVRAVDASAALRQLLAAASAPPSRAELRGRSQAIAHFRAAHRPWSSDPERGAGAASRARAGAARLTRVGRRSSARLTVACVAVLTLLGGTAADAAAGEVPTALRNAVSDLFLEPSPPRDRPAPTPSSEHPLQPGPGRTAPSPSPTSPPSSAGHPHTGAAAGQPAGLRRAYRARPASVSAAAILARPGSGPLVPAAGGAGGVTAFWAGATLGTIGSTAVATGRPIAHPWPTPGKGRRRSSGTVHAAPAAGPAKPAPPRGTTGQPGG